MKTICLITLTALFYGSCTNPATVSQQQTTSADTVAVTDTTSRSFKGIYFARDGRDYLRSCDTTYTLEGELTPLRNAYTQLGERLSYEGESAYAEINGYVAGNPGEDTPALVIRSTTLVEPKNFRSACYDFDFILLGTEPFWSVDIIAAENRIVFKDAGINQAIQFPYSKPLQQNGNWRYITRATSGEQLTILIRKENCSDGMSDRVYHYAATVSLGEKIYKGCAIRRGDTFPARD